MVNPCSAAPARSAIRDALSAGTSELIRPMKPAVRMHTRRDGRLDGRNGRQEAADGAVRDSAASARRRSDSRSAPPASEMAQASPRISPRIPPGGEAERLQHAHLAHALAHRHRHGVGGDQQDGERAPRRRSHIRNIFTLPSSDRKPTVKACSDSVLVFGRGVAESGIDRFGDASPECAGSSIRMANSPDLPRRRSGSVCSTYS